MKGWEVKTLGEICEIYQPKTISVKDLVADGPFHVFGANGIIGRYDKFNHEEPQLLVTCRGATCGSVNISLPKSWITGNAMVVRPKFEALSVRFLEYFFRGACDFSKIITGAAQPQITRQSLAPVAIAYPPLDEQRRIVAILDEAFAGLAVMRQHAEANLKNARALFDSHLNAIFSQHGEGWIERRLQDVSLAFGRGRSRHRPRNAPSLYGGEYPFIQTGDVRGSNHYITEFSQTYNETGLAQSKLWPIGTICVTIAANIAETGILSFDACFPDSVIGIVVDPKKAMNEYVEYLLQSVQARLKAQGKGSAQDNINLGTFENEVFPFPDLNEQALIVDKLNDVAVVVSQLESLYRQKLTSIDELKQSILHRAFSGALSAKAELAA